MSHGNESLITTNLLIRNLGELRKAYKNSTDAELVQKTIQAVPRDLLRKVLNKLKPDYDIFNYQFDILQ